MPMDWVCTQRNVRTVYDTQDHREVVTAYIAEPKADWDTPTVEAREGGRIQWRKRPVLLLLSKQR